MNPSTGPLVVLRGGGDLATGVAWKLHHAGIAVVVLELASPLTVRRTVSVSSAIHDGEITVEGMRAERCPSFADAMKAADTGTIAVIVSPDPPDELDGVPRSTVIVDARLAKRNLDTTMADADFVVALGPGFEAGLDCHAVVETMRGPRLGRVLWEGWATPNTGTPGEVGGRGAERVLRAPLGGLVNWSASIGDVVQSGQLLGSVAGVPVLAPFAGTIRGLIRAGTSVSTGLKIGDVDPRGSAVAAHEISDKALAVGSGVLEAILRWQRGTAPTSP